MLRKLLTFRLPEPPDEPPNIRSTFDQVIQLPAFEPIRTFFQSAYALWPSWPVLVPLLGWIGWRTYWRERAKVLNRRVAHAREEGRRNI
jgi:hypothetical protein